MCILLFPFLITLIMTYYLYLYNYVALSWLAILKTYLKVWNDIISYFVSLLKSPPLPRLIYVYLWNQWWSTWILFQQDHSKLPPKMNPNLDLINLGLRLWWLTSASYISILRMPENLPFVSVKMRSTFPNTELCPGFQKCIYIFLLPLEVKHVQKSHTRNLLPGISWKRYTKG